MTGATDGLDGYASACQRRPDGIVLDVMMPVVDGWTVLRKLRSNPALASVPVIILTALEADAARGEAQRLGAAVLRKPCDPQAIAKALRIALKSEN